MAMPSSDWFWCDQPPFHPVHSLRHLKCAPARSQRRWVTSLLPLYGPPCGSASICALSFVAAPLDCASPLGRASSSLTLLWRYPNYMLGPTFRGVSRLQPGSLCAPGSMPWALQPQWCAFLFASVNVRGFDIPRVGVRPCMQAHDGHSH